MSFNSLLNKTCTIQVKTETQDTAGQLQDTWITVYSNIKCRLNTGGGGVKEIPKVVYELMTHTLYLKIISGFALSTKNHRIIINSENYNILLVADAAGHGHHWQLALTKVE